ncbi:MAG: AmmeMemoRadiSam system radical SAM enzyme [Candidatus Thorarchaeota archaeon]
MVELHEALFYSVEKDSKVICELCPNLCKISPNNKGRCNVRINHNGKLYSLNYGLSTSGSKDPIEKKPLYHYLPGTCAYSFGTIGCNLFCEFCQNWHISRADPEEAKYGLTYISPEDAVKEAKRSGCPSVAYTYNEPLVWYEWVLDTAKLMQQEGIKNILVTNGYIQPEPLDQLLPYIDAANVDLKGDKVFYKNLCKITHQEAVLETCKKMVEKKVHLEITNLLVTNENDSIEQIQELVDFVYKELGADIPLHFSRYFPQYKLKSPPTPIETLYKARELATKRGLHYVYLGNVRDAEHSNTYCKQCSSLLINRIGYHTEISHLKDGKCTKCGTIADIILK